MDLSVNNAIKRIEKAGRGYKFDVLRDRCILSINKPAPDKFDFKKAIYVNRNKARDVSHHVQRRTQPLYEIAFKIDNHAISRHNRMLAYIQSIGRVGCISKDSP